MRDLHGLDTTSRALTLTPVGVDDLDEAVACELFADELEEHLSHSAAGGCSVSSFGCASSVGFCACTLSTLCCGCPHCLGTEVTELEAAE